MRDLLEGIILKFKFVMDQAFVGKSRKNFGLIRAKVTQLTLFQRAMKFMFIFMKKEPQDLLNPLRRLMQEILLDRICVLQLGQARLGLTSAGLVRLARPCRARSGQVWPGQTKPYSSWLYFYNICFCFLVRSIYT